MKRVDEVVITLVLVIVIGFAVWEMFSPTILFYVHAYHLGL